MQVTEDDVRLSKAWAACQEPPVTVTKYGDTNKFRLNLWDGPDEAWIPDVMASIYDSEDAAWSALATALKPVFASVRPVIEAEALERAVQKVDEFEESARCEYEKSASSYDEGRCEGGRR